MHQPTKIKYQDLSIVNTKCWISHKYTEERQASTQGGFGQLQEHYLVLW